LGKENLVKNIHSALDSLDSSINAGLEVRRVAHERTKPAREVAVELIVSKKNPLLNKGALGSGGTKKISVVLVGSEVVSNSRRLEELETISSLKDGNLAKGELLLELGGLASFKAEVGRDLNFETVVTSSNQSLGDSRVVGVGVDFLSEKKEKVLRCDASRINK
jgi:hypothetical protein